MWNPSVNSSRYTEGGSVLHSIIPEQYCQGTIRLWRQNLTGGYGPDRLWRMTNKGLNYAR